ncbi:MAG: hypothetical protein AB8H47_18460 [Bacteroidia bacterium]
MTRLSLIVVLLFLGSFTTNNVFAQKKDAMLHFKASPEMFFEAGDLKALKGDFITLADSKGFANIEVSYARKLQVPSSSQASNGPIYLSNRLKCYKVSGPKGKQGTIVWWDRNGDLKIQPLLELRCVGPNDAAAKVYVEEVSCK